MRMQRWIASAWAAGLVFAAVGYTQEFRGSLSGRVIDQQAAVVPNVKIVATETETGAKFQTVSNADGSYVLPFLPPGPYSVSAEAAGFKRYINGKVRITTNEREQLDIQLEIGAIDQSVTVTAEAAMLETATASTGQVINTRQIENLPINGRAPLALAQLAFGVTPNSDPKFSRPFDNAGPSGFSMGGAPNQSNELLIDGSPDVTRNSRVAYNPPPDAVQEIKVEAFQADAAYGHTGGGTVNVVMRGGTNQFHGSAYEFNQISNLAATPFFTNKSAKLGPDGSRTAGFKPTSRFNQWGLTAGGPIWLPKIINGKDKLFFFFGYEGIHDAFPEPQTETVATAAERNGDFSQLLTVGSNYAIYDPLTGVKQSNGRVQRTPFAGNIIPQNRLSSIAKNLLSYIPLPNQSGTKDGASNYIDDSIRRDVFDGELGRLDYNINENHKFFYSFRHNYRVEDRNNHYHNIATGNLLNRINWGSTLDDVYTFSPTTVMNVRLNWTRFTEANDKPSAGFDFTKLGFPSYIAASSQRMVFPIIDLNQFSDWGDNGGDRTPFDIFQIFGSVTKLHGQHTLKFGGDVRELRESSSSYGNSGGQYVFREDYTRGPLDNSTAAPLGQDLAALMLGYPTSGGFDINAFRTNQAKYWAVFVQDDFRPRSNLTFNIGLRFEGDLGTTERFNRSVSGFDPAATLSVTSAAEAAYALKPVAGGVPASAFKVRGGLLYEGQNSKYVYEPNFGYFSPRFGFAWTPGGSGRGTVIRGGFGVFVAPIITQGINQPGFSQNTAVLGATTTGNLLPAVTLDNPFPGGIQRPTGAALGTDTFLGKSVTFYNPHPQNPYSIRWNLDIQRQIGKGAVFEIGYTGNHYVHLTIDQNLNGTPAQYLSSSPFRDQPVIDRNSTTVANPFAGLLPGTNLSGSTVSFTQLTLPFPQFTGVTMSQGNGGESYFHALQTRFEKRFSHGFQILANYQFSRTFTKDTYQNSFGPLEKRPADIDRPHRFVTSFGYELPFGKGQPLLGGLSGFSGAVLDRIVGGWMVNGIFSYESGGPAGNWGDVIYFGGPLNWNPNNPDHVFDTTSFNTVSSQQLSNHIRTFPTRFSNLRLPPTNNLDASVIKNTRIRERVMLQYRCEFFNAFNHPVFNGPNLTVTSSAAGTVSSVYNIERHIQMALRLTW
jgi:hypothetical protein